MTASWFVLSYEIQCFGGGHQSNENGSIPQTEPVGPFVFLWTPSTQQQPLPNPRCHGSLQVQTSSVVVIVESHTSEQLSVNTDLFSQDWSCEFRDD